MKNIAFYLLDGIVESKCMLGNTSAIDVMNIIVSMVRFQLASMKATHYAVLQLSQRHRLGHLKESPFTQDQEQVSEGSNTADSDKKKEGDGAGEWERKRRGRRRESVPKPLNEIKAPHKTPLISIVELISSSSSALVGS